ncbi:uncharacterized protein PV06_10890 [Exophiala oligosperma]|uniref:Protein kinase domain-containing protein n=1 Tax=Exophiala oligosperma TaxID=215243 RepID=A0A0D2BHW5_9EURO|nr:uncharacterized protein PV06_10890 [Exophiala oligosperma]KIW36992.1 hypothetical protein PV06_10890 [Exophiala oligosperma]
MLKSCIRWKRLMRTNPPQTSEARGLPRQKHLTKPFVSWDKERSARSTWLYALSTRIARTVLIPDKTASTWLGLWPDRRLVAVKVVEQGPAGGANAERIEVGLQREMEILKSIRHPSLVHLKAFGKDRAGRALLVMNYCPGGDLFEVATKYQEVLVPTLVRRIFAELVSAVRYLHQKFIVHRDIKLENILLNIPVRVHSNVPNWQTLDRAVVILTDMGLSRRIPEPPESPLLTTRCGSEDYAAPEILMGQPYDGHQTDAWALGVVLYALMEGRLPFDPNLELEEIQPPFEHERPTELLDVSRHGSSMAMKTATGMRKRVVTSKGLSMRGWTFETQHTTKATGRSPRDALG